MKLPSLSTFRKFYRDATYRYTSDNWFESQPLLQPHSELPCLVRFIVEHSETPRECLIANYARQESREQATQATDADKIRAFNLAYSVIAMLPCAERNSFHIQFPGLAPVTWTNSQAACQVWEAAIPKGRNLTNGEVRSVMQDVSAKRLHDSGFKLVVTNDPRLHLAIETTTIGKQKYVFHQVGVLKQYLSSQGRRDSVAK